MPCCIPTYYIPWPLFRIRVNYMMSPLTQIALQGLGALLIMQLHTKNILRKVYLGLLSPLASSPHEQLPRQPLKLRIKDTRQALLPW